jgi:outer membrane protein assembly factor BamB
MQRRHWLAVFVLACPGHATFPGEQWDRFRGPSGSGVAGDDARLPDACDPAKNLLWSLAIDAGASSPCVHGERVYVTGHGEHELVTLCVDRRDGRLVWRRAIEVKDLERAYETHGPASPTPVAADGCVVVYFGSFGLVCYDPEGTELWRRELATPKNTFGTAASPIVAGKRLVFVSDANDASYVEALDLATGETQWRRERAGFESGWSTPGTWTRNGVEELLVLGVWWLTAYDLADGAERWSVPGLTDEPITTPVTGEGFVFVTSYNLKTNPEASSMWSFERVLAEHDHDADEKIDASEAAENTSILSRPDADGEGDHPLKIFFRFLDVDRDGEITHEEWKKLEAWLDEMKQANGIFAIRPGEGERAPEIAWQFPRGVPECPSPLYYKGRVWMVMNGGLVTCLDAKTGALVFQEHLAARGPYYASPVAGDGKIYAASARGELTVIEAADELKVLAHAELGERLLATPALSQGVVFVRTESKLWAFGSRE